MSTLEGKVVIVTGASSGIGEATSRHLASLGARLEVRVCMICPGLTQSELPESLTVPAIREQARGMYQAAMPAAAIAGSQGRVSPARRSKLLVGPHFAREIGHVQVFPPPPDEPVFIQLIDCNHLMRAGPAQLSQRT